MSNSNFSSTAAYLQPPGMEEAVLQSELQINMPQLGSGVWEPLVSELGVN